MERESTSCLNCGTTLKANFCKSCGQKSSTKRFTVSQLITSDFLVSFFSLEKGFLFTLKSLFTKPGHLVREYIEGKRNTYFHFLTFLLIILTLSIFIGEFSTVKLADLFKVENTNFLNDFEKFNKENPRILLLLMIPLQSLISFLIFKKANHNYAENIIINTYKSSGEFVIGILFTIATIFYTKIKVLSYLYQILITFVTIYSIWFYF